LIRAEFLETAVWREVCNLLRNPEKLQREFHEGGKAITPLQNKEALKAKRLKQQHGSERLIDSFTGGLIERSKRSNSHL
jgi:site-specific DNA recombinase